MMQWRQSCNNYCTHRNQCFCSSFITPLLCIGGFLKLPRCSQFGHHYSGGMYCIHESIANSVLLFQQSSDTKEWVSVWVSEWVSYLFIYLTKWPQMFIWLNSILYISMTASSIRLQQLRKKQNKIKPKNQAASSRKVQMPRVRVAYSVTAR